MTARAFIVAIENYPDSQGMANQLPGTNTAANEFWAWFVEKKVKPVKPKLDATDVVIGCVDHPYEWRTTGTTRAEILKALKKLVQTGRDNTSELYLFFAGHGFSYTDMGWTRAIDVLVGSDFVSQEESGGSCIKLQEIQEKLWTAMGPGDHYYFIDACRNTTTHAKINVLDTGLIFTASELGKPYIYTLYSTVKGTAAEVESGFTDALVSGLRGSGRAKGWQEDNLKMYVKFDLLVDYVEKKLPSQAVDPKKDGNGKGLILELVPTPKSNCEIRVNNADAADEFTVLAKTTFGKDERFKFQGASYSLELPPFLYNMEVTHPAQQVVRVKPPLPGPLDLYDPCEVQFTKSDGTVEPLAVDSTLLLSHAPTPHSVLELENLHTGAIMHSGGSAIPRGRVGVTRGIAVRPESTKSAKLRKNVEPGTYVLRLHEHGVVVSRQKVTVNPGERVSVNLSERPQSKIRKDILTAVFNDPGAHVAVFSEKHLGPTANWDLSLWLSIFGASRIVGSKIKHEFRKLEKLALEGFGDIAKNQSCVYVLAGFEKSQGRYGVGLSRGKQVDWESLREVKGLTSVYQWRKKTVPGSYLLSLQLPEQVPTTLATYCLPNRATFVVFAEDEMGRMSVRQYMLPVGELIQYLEPTVKQRLGNNPLGLVRYMCLAQSQFARKRSLEPEKNSDEELIWREVVNGKWLDPIMSLIAAYYFVRQGLAGPTAKPDDKNLIRIIMTNLRKYFRGIPDIEAIGKLVKDRWVPPRKPPLLLDGLLAFGKSEPTMLPLPLSHLDFNGPWTTWRDAVNAFKTITPSSGKKRGIVAETRKSSQKIEVKVAAAKAAGAKAAMARGPAAKKSGGKKVAPKATARQGRVTRKARGKKRL